jgi:hypothetical protein
LFSANSFGPCEGTSHPVVVNNYTEVIWQSGLENDTIFIDTTTLLTARYSLNGCSAIVDTLMSLNPLPTTPILSGDKNASDLCEGDSILISVDSGADFVWFDGIPSVLSRKFGANESVFVTAQTTQGCFRNSAVFDINFKALPLKPVIELEGNPNVLCEGNDFRLTTNTNLSLIWSHGDLNKTTLVNANGAYFVSVFENGCKATSDTITLTFKERPIMASINYLASPGMDSLQCSENGQSYIWYLEGADLELNQRIIASETIGDYSVQYQGTNGCWSTNSLPFTVVGINDLAFSHIRVATFPGKWELTLPEDILEFGIFNMQGQSVRHINKGSTIIIPRDGFTVFRFMKNGRSYTVKLL